MWDSSWRRSSKGGDERTEAGEHHPQTSAAIERGHPGREWRRSRPEDGEGERVRPVEVHDQIEPRRLLDGSRRGPLLDHLIRPRQHRRRDREAERLGGLETIWKDRPTYRVYVGCSPWGENRATGERRPVMEKDTTYVALDDSKRTITAGILRPGEREPELRQIPNEPRLLRRLVERLTREGPVRVCYEAGVSGYDLHRQLTALGRPLRRDRPGAHPAPAGAADQDGSPRRGEAGPALPRRGAHPDPCARRGRGSGPGPPALPRRHSRGRRCAGAIAS